MLKSLFSNLGRLVCGTAAQWLPGVIIAGITGLAAPSVAVAEPVKVVASFSVLADMVRVIGADDIELTSLIGPGEDAHAYDPGPADIRALSRARVLVVNGLGFEGWMPRLVRASGFNGAQIVASDGVKPLALEVGAGHHHHGHGGHHGHDDHQEHGAHDHDDARTATAQLDPHAWQDLKNGMVYAKNIAEGLARVDPANASKYHERADQYISLMQAQDARVKAALAAIPSERRRVVTPHAAFGYFGAAYGVSFFSAAGLSSDAEPSAKDIARLIKDIRASHSTALFSEGSSAGARVIAQVARETGLKVGGVLFSDSLDVPGQPAGTYLGMFLANADQIISALTP